MERRTNGKTEKKAEAIGLTAIRNYGNTDGMKKRKRKERKKG